MHPIGFCRICRKTDRDEESGKTKEVELMDVAKETTEKETVLQEHFTEESVTDEEVDLMAVAKETEKTEAVIKEDFARKDVETKEVV